MIFVGLYPKEGAYVTGPIGKLATRPSKPAALSNKKYHKLFATKPAFGIPGRLKDDLPDWVVNPNYSTVEYEITEEAYKRAITRLENYYQLMQDGQLTYSLFQGQCAIFALDVAKSTGVALPKGGIIPRPSVLRKQLKALENSKYGKAFNNEY